MKRIFCAGFAYLAHISLFGQKSSICMFYPYFRHILKFCRTSLHHIFGGAIWVIAYYFGAFPSFSSLFCHFFWVIWAFMYHTPLCVHWPKKLLSHILIFFLWCVVFFFCESVTQPPSWRSHSSWQVAGNDPNWTTMATGCAYYWTVISGPQGSDTYLGTTRRCFIENWFFWGGTLFLDFIFGPLGMRYLFGHCAPSHLGTAHT